MTEASANEPSCVHPHDSVHTISVYSPKGEVEISHWCRDCGAFRCRQGVDNLRDLSKSPWREWELPRHKAAWVCVDCGLLKSHCDQHGAGGCNAPTSEELDKIGA
jgi:hypothetical protein